MEAYPAPSNGAKLPPKGQSEIGCEYNLMQMRPLRRSYGEVRTEDYFLTFSFGIFDWLSLDGKLGTGDLRQKGGIHFPKIEYNTGFAGGYGFRIKGWEDKTQRLSAIFGFQHISVHPRDKYEDADKYEIFLDDWQLSALLAKDFAHFSAYTGIKTSDCQMVYKINELNKKRRYSKQHIGIVTGVSFDLFEQKTRLTLEGRFIDETAFSFNLAYLF